MVTHLIQARYTKHCTLSVPSPHPAMCPPHWDRVPSPSGSKPVSNLSIFQGTQNYFARKREGAGGGWESHSISHLHHPSTRAWIDLSIPHRATHNAYWPNRWTDWHADCTSHSSVAFGEQFRTDTAPRSSRACQACTLKTELITLPIKLPSLLCSPSQPRGHPQPLHHSEKIVCAATVFQACARHKGGSGDTGEVKSLPSKASAWFSTLSARIPPVPFNKYFEYPPL